MVGKDFIKTNFDFSGFRVPRLMTAPMDGITDYPMRRMIRKFSKDILLFSEMVHVATFLHGRFFRDFSVDVSENPIIFQFLINENSVDFIGPAVDKILAAGVRALNLNCGCPARTVVNSGGGSFLMSDSSLFHKIFSSLLSSVDGRVPVTVKIRAGFRKKNAVEIARLAEQEGASGLIVHPRLATEQFSGPLDFSLVRKIKETVSIPVVFSGDILDREGVKKVFDKTGVDGVMIGRALWGAPWKIREILDDDYKFYDHFSKAGLIKLMIEHLKMNVEYYGAHGFQAFKKHIPRYLHSFEQASHFRELLLRTKNLEEMLLRLNEISFLFGR